MFSGICGQPAKPHVPSHWRDCHSAAPPSTFSLCFNRDSEVVSVRGGISTISGSAAHSCRYPQTVISASGPSALPPQTRVTNPLGAVAFQPLTSDTMTLAMQCTYSGAVEYPSMSCMWPSVCTLRGFGCVPGGTCGDIGGGIGAAPQNARSPASVQPAAATSSTGCALMQSMQAWAPWPLARLHSSAAVATQSAVDAAARVLPDAP